MSQQEVVPVEGYVDGLSFKAALDIASRILRWGGEIPVYFRDKLIIERLDDGRVALVRMDVPFEGDMGEFSIRKEDLKNIFPLLTGGEIKLSLKKGTLNVLTPLGANFVMIEKPAEFRDMAEELNRKLHDWATRLSGTADSFRKLLRPFKRGNIKYVAFDLLNKKVTGATDYVTLTISTEGCEVFRLDDVYDELIVILDLDYLYPIVDAIAKYDKKAQIDLFFMAYDKPVRLTMRSDLLTFDKMEFWLAPHLP